MSNPREGFFEKSPLGFDILFADGHTEKQMIPHMQYQGKTLVFMADLITNCGPYPLAICNGL